jgi:hypothetical protein
MLAGTALRVEEWYTDPDDLFASALLRRTHHVIPSQEEP